MSSVGEVGEDSVLSFNAINLVKRDSSNTASRVLVGGLIVLSLTYFNGFLEKPLWKTIVYVVVIYSIFVDDISPDHTQEGAIITIQNT